jgi:hypothetical protein
MFRSVTAFTQCFAIAVIIFPRHFSRQIDFVVSLKNQAPGFASSTSCAGIAIAFDHFIAKNDPLVVVVMPQSLATHFSVTAELEQRGPMLIFLFLEASGLITIYGQPSSKLVQRQFHGSAERAAKA